MDEAVLDVEIGAGGESGAETTQQPDPNAQRQSDKEYTAWVKSLREDGEQGKHFRRVKDDFGRVQALSKIDPKGIDGIRSTYDGIKSVAYGEKTGLEAVETMRSALAESQGLLDGVADGNFEALSEDHRAGIIRMTPQLLDTLAETNPDAYTAALLPHFVDALHGSGLTQHFSQLVSVLSQKPPDWLTPQQVPQWTQERLREALTSAQAASQWFKDQDRRVQEMGGKQGNNPPIRTNGEAKPAAESGTTSPQYWQEKVYPETNKHAEETFNRELKPWEEKLAAKGFRLSKLEKEALAQKFVSGVISQAQGNKDYVSQMTRYNKMKSPDAASVVSVFRGEFNRHANNVMKQLVEENYGDKLKGGKPGPKPVQRTGTPSALEKGVQYGSVKPRREDIDIVKTPKEWLYDDTRFRRILKNGRTFELRA